MLPISVHDTSSPFSFVKEPSAEDLEHYEANLALVHDKYKYQISTFPKVKGWRNDDLYMYQGFWFNSGHEYSVETTMALQDSFHARSTDIFIITPPKSGTTWIKALVFATVNRTMYKNKPPSTHPLLNFNPHICVPFLETDELLRKTPTYMDTHSPRLFGTHIPYTCLPQSIIDSGCRIVYMCRNPKDVMVSWFNWTNKLSDRLDGLVTIEEMFEAFSKGLIPYGPYWDHVKGFHKAGLDHPTKILFLTYENMKMDAASNVKRLAEFLDCPFMEEEEAEGAVEEIVKLCSFEGLKEVNKDGNYSEGIPNNSFFGEGKVGGWRNHLTTEMSRLLNDIATEKFQGLDILF